MASKLCLVTGANSGIGRATSARFASTGWGVVMVCRDRARGEAARNEIVSQTKDQPVDLLTCDLASLASVRALVADFEEKYSTLDALVNNAAVFTRTRELTRDGLELMFATNYLGPFLMTRLLLPRLKAAKSSRIINVTAPSTTRPNLDDLQGQSKFSALNAFGASKAAELLFSFALARRLKGSGVTVNAYHPGVVRGTKLNRTAPPPIRFLAGMINLVAGRTPAKAAEGLVELAASDRFAETSGQLVHDGRIISAPFIDDADLQERLWSASCVLAGVPETL